MNREEYQRRAMEWMRGRRGADDIVVFCMYLAIVLLVVNAFARQAALGWIVLALMAYAFWRTGSKNLGARAAENERFLKLLGPARPWLQNPKAALAELRTYRHVKCTKCGQRMRVPRGKGRLRVTCPKCGEKFETKS